MVQIIPFLTEPRQGNPYSENLLKEKKVRKAKKQRKAQPKLPLAELELYTN
jgi:hypothetical protein